MTRKAPGSSSCLFPPRPTCSRSSIASCAGSSGSRTPGVDEDARPDVLAQVQADAATTWRSSAEALATVRGVERLRAWCEGFSLHAAVVVHDRAALERLCRYGAGPALAQERLA